MGLELGGTPDERVCLVEAADVRDGKMFCKSEDERVIRSISASQAAADSFPTVPGADDRWDRLGKEFGAVPGRESYQ